MTKEMLINILVAIMVCSMGFYLYAKNHPSVAYVDVNTALNRAAVALSKTKLTKKTQTKIIKSFASNLDKTIKEYAGQNNILIITVPVFSSRALDVTNNIVRLGIRKEVLHA